jgi:hypothetical protein
MEWWGWLLALFGLYCYCTLFQTFVSAFQRTSLLTIGSSFTLPDGQVGTVTAIRGLWVEVTREQTVFYVPHSIANQQQC